jgi:SOS response regulatory protein OraA/RecX
MLSQIVWEWLAKLGENPFLDLLLIGAFVVIAVAVIAVQWRRVRVAELQAALKKQMLERGMSAEDIEKVLRAAEAPAPEPEQESLVPFTGNTAADSPRLVKLLLEHGYSGDDIERVLRALDCAARREATEGSDALFRQKATMVATMAENSLEVADMEKILQAFEARPVR